MPSPIDLILVRTSRTDDAIGAIGKRLDRLEHTLGTLHATINGIELTVDEIRSLIQEMK